jgi:hypothetical protein
MNKLLVIALLALVLSSLVLMGCVNETPPVKIDQNYSYVEPGEEPPMPSQEDLENAEPPEMPL